LADEDPQGAWAWVRQQNKDGDSLLQVVSMLVAWCEGESKDSQPFISKMLEETVQALANAEPAIWNHLLIHLKEYPQHMEFVYSQMKTPETDQDTVSIVLGSWSSNEKADTEEKAATATNNQQDWTILPNPNLLESRRTSHY
jgi:hypothetical protein